MQFFSDIKQNYQLLWKAIIRPPRAEYEISDLGPNKISVSKTKVRRTDIELVNKKGLKLQCSHFEPINRVQEELPCVIYLHANSSSRVEGLNCLESLLPNNITVFCFDFAGCGLSEGKYISLGYYERDDVEVAVNYLRNSKRVSTIGLWGRSMGAVTALMYSDRDPSIAGLVLDSPFSNLEQLARELAARHSKIPGMFVSAAISMISGTIKKEHGFEIEALNPLQNVKKAFIPAFFIVGGEDDFVVPEHTQKLYDAYAGEKKIKIIDDKGQGHNSSRPKYIKDSIAIFFYESLHVEHLVKQPPKELESGEGYPDMKSIKTKPVIFHNYEQDSYSNIDEEAMIQEAIKLSLQENQKK